MADVSMCADLDCPSRMRCFRYVAAPDPEWQPYGGFRCTPGAENCPHFLPVVPIHRIDDEGEWR